MGKLYFRKIRLFFISILLVLIYSNASYSQEMCSNANGTLVPDIPWQIVTTTGGYWDFNAIDISSFSKGIYYLRVKEEGFLSVRKIIIQ